MDTYSQFYDTVTYKGEVQRQYICSLDTRGFVPDSLYLDVVLSSPFKTIFTSTDSGGRLDYLDLDGISFRLKYFTEFCI